MLYALAGIVIGFAAGWYFPLYLPFEYARLLSVSLMAALDTVLAVCAPAWKANMIMPYLLQAFYQCCFGSVLCYSSILLGIDLYLVAILIFGMRIFNNLAAIRHLFLKNKIIFNAAGKYRYMLNII